MPQLHDPKVLPDNEKEGTVPETQEGVSKFSKALASNLLCSSFNPNAFIVNISRNFIADRYLL
jgi:hypothetical protein